MKKISLTQCLPLIIAITIMLALCISPVTAGIIIDENYHESKVISKKGTIEAYYSDYTGNDMFFVIDNIVDYVGMTYIAVTYSGNTVPAGFTGDGKYAFKWGFSRTSEPYDGVVYITRSRGLLGQVTATHYTWFFYDWAQHASTKTGKQYIWHTDITISGLQRRTSKPNIDNDFGIFIGGWTDRYGVFHVTHPQYTIAVAGVQTWKNRLVVDDDTPNAYHCQVTREIDGLNYYSVVSGGDVRNADTKDSEFYIIRPVNQITVESSLGKNYTYPLDGAPGPDGPDGPDEQNVIVYIKNSQTGALIANSQIVIDALVDGEYYNVVNRTEPSGIFSITLQPTGGGQPNPDGYRLIVTADGYNNPMPEINFTVDDYKQSIYCLLDPIAGGPANENKTFIDFFVSDMYANPISGATVKFGKYTLITNNAGYTVFEVDKSNTYTWTVSKSGYGTLTGNAVIGDAPRHTINTYLSPPVTPVKPTPTPPSTPIKPTPIMTAPSGEPVSNWLEWFAAHFGMILGGGVEIGKIFMWLCFTVPVGVYVGKEAKAGAAGFMAGAGVVTLFFVLIGWVPIWLVVLLALIIGLLYAKVFNTPDNGGGR